MANLKWDIEVEDRASANAKRISSSLRRLEKRLLAVDAAARGVSARTMKGATKAAGAAGTANQTSGAARRFGANLDKLANHFGGAEGGARKLGAAIVTLEKRLTGAATKLASTPAQRGIQRQSRLTRSASDGGMGVGDILAKTFFAMELFKTAVRTLSSVFGAATRTIRGALGVGLQQTKFQRGFDFNLGKEGGAAFMADTTRFAEQFGMDLTGVRSQALTLLDRGFSTDTAFQVMQAVADMQSSGAVSGADAEGIVRAMAQIRGKDVLSLEELNGQLGEYIDVGKAMSRIAARVGVPVENLRNLISQGKVSSALGFEGLMDYFEQDKSGGKLGSRAMKAAQDIDKLEQRLRDRPKRFLEKMDLTGLMKGYQNFLQGLVKLTDPEGDFGKRIQAAMTKVLGAVEELFGRYLGEDGFKRLESDVGNLVAKIETLATALEKVVKLLGFVGETYGVATGVITEGASTGANIAGKGIRGLTTQLLPTLPGIGTLFKPLMLWLDANPERAADALGAEKHAAGGLVTRPHFGLVGERGPELIVPLSKLPMMRRGAGGGSTVNVTVNAPGATAADAETIGQVVRREVTALFDELALSSGVA